MVEKHMSPGMDAGGSQKIDWSFNEYVYGTQMPRYKLDHSFYTGADGTIVMSLNITQSGVDDTFRMVVPVYLELDDGSIVFFARMRVVGNKSEAARVAVTGMTAST